MRVQRIQLENEHDLSFELFDDEDQPIPMVSGFMKHLRARGCSPNTLSAYAYDLLHFMSFLQEQRLSYEEFRPPHALLFLEYLSELPSKKAARRKGRGLYIRDSFTLSSPSAHRLEHDHLFKVVQRLNRILDRKLLLIYTLPVSSIQCSNHQILIANDFRVENGENSRNNLI